MSDAWNLFDVPIEWAVRNAEKRLHQIELKIKKLGLSKSDILSEIKVHDDDLEVPMEANVHGPTTQVDSD
jgi:hypothetical protein